MAEDQEKKFHSIMDKLFHSPPSRGVKRPNQGNQLVALADPKSGGSDEAQLSQQPRSSVCRPWDRGDLMRRLSTFKSMTWFAKPKAVDAVNCARRGWINVDMDIVACEICGARILFSTPSAWSREQVEKAALVFSLKLDNGHKLHCPWIDNACDESLARFPPTPVPVLVDGFKQRSSALVHLRALPIISSAAVSLMTTPQLGQFLQLNLELEMENSSMPLAAGMEPSNNLYDEALKLISLCGWEPRALPYMVIGKNANVQSPSHSATDSDQEIVMIDPSNIVQASKKNENMRNSSDLLSDPRSVVLDCKLCGASVGLWAFSTISRPLETFRLVGFTELDDGKNSPSGTLLCGNSGDERNVVFGGSSSHPTSEKAVSHLNLSIAGGPLPTNQNFKATISLPVIGRSIRARLSSDSNYRNSLGITDGDSWFKSMALPSEGTENTEDASGSSTKNQPSLTKPVGWSACDDANCNLREGIEISGAGTFVGESSNGPAESNVLVVRSNDLVNQHADEDVIISFDDASEGVTVSFDDNSQIDAVEASDPRKEQMGLEIVPVSTVGVSVATNRDSGGGKCLEIQEASALQKEALEDVGTDLRNQLSVEQSPPPGSNSRLMSEDGVMHFDPVRQHRPFCLWITSDGGGIPGWQQTLSALLHQKEGSDSTPVRSLSASIVKVDDPVNSVRRLFTSKRRKSTVGPS
ncbi:hypothetical protein MLD38_032818 [Melastoma candidum]|uniref:Uncharacterized protein n=1 Tax=Melastoma candidum TaxID=119954 RepID=A0ACB9M5D4_9MYRT|nr:hypothetical protein MLD38_032818 [Melastoma candidum]